MNLKYTFDDCLREVPESAADMRAHAEALEREGKLSQAGAYFRIVGELDRAEACLTRALAASPDIPTRIRLAHVYQWKKNFARSDRMFSDILAAVAAEADAKYADFALQHAGKNHFDQGRLSEALYAFEAALELRRERGAEPDQIESTLHAIRETEKRLGKHSSREE